MKKKTLLAALSLSLVVGLGGIAVAAPGANMTTDQPTVSEMQTYMENQDIPSTEEDKKVSPDNDQLSQEMADVFKKMVESDIMTEEQLENMPYTQEMPMNNQVSGQMENMSQQNMHGQGMTENHMPNAQQGHNSGGNGMMGSSGRMGR